MRTRLVTFNVRSGLAVRDGVNAWWARRSTVVEVLAALDADVVGVQEAYAFQLRYLLRSMSSYTATGVGRNDGRRRGEHAAILFRTARFSLERSETRWLSDEPGVPGSCSWGNPLPRIATLAWLRDRSSGRRLGVLGTHFDSASALARQRSAEAVLEWVGAEDGTWVVVGDLNAAPGDPPLAALAAGGYRDALAGTVGGTAHGWRGGEHGPRIDHVLLPDGLAPRLAVVARHGRRGRLPSDHWPVVVDVDL